MPSIKYRLYSTGACGGYSKIATFKDIKHLLSFVESHPCDPKYNEYYIIQSETKRTRLSIEKANGLVK